VWIEFSWLMIVVEFDICASVNLWCQALNWQWILSWKGQGRRKCKV